MLENRWWWIRHAAIFNPKSLIFGNSDVAILPPTPAEVKALKARLPVFSKIVLSDLSRTRDTLKHLGIISETLLIDPALREQNFGRWEGKNWAEAAPLEHPFWADPARNTPPKGESFAQMCQRINAAILRIDRAIGKGYDILSIGHAGTIRAALIAAQMVSFDQALNIQVPHLSLTRIP